MQKQASALVQTPAPHLDIHGPPPLNQWEWDRIHHFVKAGLMMLGSEQYLEEGMNLAEFCEELRDLDCEDRWMDEVIMSIMCSQRGEMQRVSGETFVRIHPQYRAYIAKCNEEDEAQKENNEVA